MREGLVISTRSWTYDGIETNTYNLPLDVFSAPDPIDAAVAYRENLDGEKDKQRKLDRLAAIQVLLDELATEQSQLKRDLT